MMYRFTDWYNEENDCYGSYEECLAVFNKALEEEPDKRISIYMIEDNNGNECDEGVLFNENCSEYSKGK